MANRTFPESGTGVRAAAAEEDSGAGAELQLLRRKRDLR